MSLPSFKHLVRYKFRPLVRQLVPMSLRRRVVRYTRWPPVGQVDMGSLRRVKPVSRSHGGDRGTPVDRYYIEQFLSGCEEHVYGRVLEVADNTYTRRFGGAKITESEVLHVAEGHAGVTIVGDLTNANHIPDSSFDCIVLTQTLQFIYDVHAAVATVHRTLKPGGVALVTVPGITKVSRYDLERWGHYWNFTTQSARALFAEYFPASEIQVTAYGNVLTAVAFLHGLAMEELGTGELDYSDAEYPVLICIKATKSVNDSGLTSFKQEEA